jgi:hypothetical protein
MAGEAKISKAVLDETASILSKIPEDKIDDAAAKLGFESERLRDFINNPKAKGAKQFFSNVAEKLGNTIKGAQNFYDQVTGRAPTVLEEFGAKYGTGGGRPPAVLPAYTKETEVGAPPELNYMTVGKGDMVPSGSRALARTADTLNGEFVQDPKTGIISWRSSETAMVPWGPVTDKPAATPDELRRMAAEAKQAPGQPGVQEVTPGRSTSLGGQAATEAERAADYNAGIPELLRLPSAKTIKTGAGVGAAVGVGTALALALRNTPFGSTEQDAVVAPTVAISGTDGTPESVNNLIDNAEAAGGITPEQKTEMKDRVKTLAELFTEAEQARKKEYKEDKARLELFQMLDKIVDGVATMIGANAMLNRGSPFALDFSKGPQIDWTAKLSTLQKELDTDIKSLTERYKLQETLQQKREAAAAREQQRAEDRAFQEAMLDKKLAAQAAATEAKAETAEQKEFKTKDKAYGELLKAVERKDAANVEKFGYMVGMSEKDRQAIKDEMKQGWFGKAVGSIQQMLSSEEASTLSGILERNRPKPAAPAAQQAPAAEKRQLPSAIIDPANPQQKISRPPNMSDDEWAKYIDANKAKIPNLRMEF